MSADNAILIAKFSDGYRVVHAQAIENIDYYPEGSKKRKETLKEYFGNSEVFETYEGASKEADRKVLRILNSDCPILEYGVLNLGELEDFN